VLGLLPPEVRNQLAAPVRDALAYALLAILEQYQTRANQGAELGDILRSTGAYLDGLAADYDRYRTTGESDSSLRARCFAFDTFVTPEILLLGINAILTPFTSSRAKYFEAAVDCGFFNDGAGSYAWDSFVFDGLGSVSPRYEDRLYPDDATANGGVSLTSREVAGAWCFADNLGRYFVIRCPDMSDDVFTAIVALIEITKGEGMRCQIIVDSALLPPPTTSLGNLAFYDLGHLSLGV